MASSLSFFLDPRPPHVVGNPPLRESVKLVELCLRVVFRGVADVNPVDQKLLDLVTGEVRILFMDALNGLLKRVRPENNVKLPIKDLPMGYVDSGECHAANDFRPGIVRAKEQ